ncbi:hypothetical protein LR48_Vigan01g153900 [Vigna angularis]|uniref:RRM domain-containing protein n=1 Tax=Phaseolus angularis TaxID=3914 RepID=A0A0L9TN43_PHAAN|nr:hypothetical protein LR48_Vigan01g153900 [Vigna angularis]
MHYVISWNLQSRLLATLKEENASSKTIYVTNLSYRAEKADVENFFKECGEIVEVRLHRDNEGRLKGFGHITFATAEAALKFWRTLSSALLSISLVFSPSVEFSPP